MFKSLVIAGSIALGALAMTGEADAKTRVGIYFGVPFYDYQVAPGWRYYDGYGWYDYGRYGDVYRRYPARDRMSCGEARRLVDRSGYDHVRVIECNGRTYAFSAVNRRGRLVTVYVNARSGAVWRG